MSDQIYWNAVNLVPEIGPATFQKLLNRYSCMEDAWRTSFKGLKQCGISPKVAEKIITLRKEVDPDQEWEKLEKHNTKMVTLRDSGYPILLKEIPDPPALLYIKGRLEKDAPCLAAVGTRKASAYGQAVVQEIIPPLSQVGLWIVSGLALGIDALVHEAVVKVKGKGIAVLAGGLDEIYPRANYRLAEKILENGGALISEYPLGTSAQKYHFPVRNRIISGLSLGTLVVEAGKKSGALITAREALEQNREVFAVPGSIYSENSLGPNNLIKMGAKMVTETEDILEALNFAQMTNFQQTKEIVADTKEEEIILKILSQEPIHIDEITKNCRLSTSLTNSTLTLMEMKGKVRNLGNMHYVLAS